MATPFIALVNNVEQFSPEVHSRRDLHPFKLTISQKESEFAYLKMDMAFPQGGLASLADRRILLSAKGRLLFDGMIQPTPRGVIGTTVTLDAIAKPPLGATFDQWISDLTNNLKTAPYYDALFVPEGSETDIAETLAARAQVIGHSRIQGWPSACPANGGTTFLSLGPTILANTLEYDASTKVAKTYKLKLQAKWRQIGRDPHTADQLRNVKTLTADEFLKDWPAQGAEIGDGFKVSRSVGVKKPDPMGITYYPRVIDKPSSLDPAWAAATKMTVRSPLMHELDLALSLEYQYEVRRTESASIELNVNISNQFTNTDVEEDEITLRDLTEKSGARPWQSRQDYAVGDEVTDGGQVYICRTAHRSAFRRSSSEWTLVGETSYLASRRMPSFFKSDRGNRALFHGLQRLVARATIASRCVTVKFTCAMPAPWLVTHDTQVRIDSEKLPGGYAEGRLVDYELSWDRGRQVMTGTIACIPGTGGGSTPSIASVSGPTPQAFGRVEFELKNTLEDQLKAFNAGQNIPITQLDIKTTPAANEDYEAELVVAVSGSLSLPQQVSP